MEKELDCKISETEDIRQRITLVAELFEKKEIKQKYSFEVLCDFIYDKAKRLFSKYDGLLKDQKGPAGADAGPLKKFQHSENETISLKRQLTTNNMIANEFINRFSELMGEKLPEIGGEDEEAGDSIR